MGRECKYHAHFMIASKYWYFDTGIQRRNGLFWNKFNVSDCSAFFLAPAYAFKKHGLSYPG